MPGLQIKRRFMRATPPGALAWVCLFALAAVAGGQTPDVPTTEQVEQSVEDTADLLDGGVVRPTRPWYDDATDGIRRLDLREERKAPSWNLSWLPSLMKGMGWLAVGAVALVVLLILWRLILHWRSGKDEADSAAVLDSELDAIDRVEALPFRVARQATDPLSEARRQYELGNFNEAIIYLFSHQLLELDKQHVIHLVRGKTNRQLLREIGPRRELQLLVEQTMIAFEDVFFGEHALSCARFESCWFELERFDRLLREAAP